MYPYLHLWVDREGFARCRELLATAGMPFTEEERTAFNWINGEPPVTDVLGYLHTPFGRVPCRLRDTMGRQFDVRIPIAEEWLDLFGELERVFAGHVLPRPGAKAGT